MSLIPATYDGDPCPRLNDCIPCGEPGGFPTWYTDLNLSRSFADQWQEMQAVRREFLAAWNSTNDAAVRLRRPFRLPDALADEWMARWALGLMVSLNPLHADPTPDERSAAVRDVAALVDAVRGLRRVRPGAVIVVTEYDRRLAAPFHRATSWASLRGGPVPQQIVCGDESGREVVGFLNRARTALHAEGGSAEWFARLGYDLAPDAVPLFDGADLADRAARVLREHVPVLSAQLGVVEPMIAGGGLVPEEVFERTRAWCVHTESTRPELFVSPPTSESVPQTTQHPDGPADGCRVWWQGESHDVPPGVTYRMIEHCWDRDVAHYDGLVGPVFDDAVEPQTIRSRCSAVNAVLREIGVGWELTADSRNRIVRKRFPDAGG